MVAWHLIIIVVVAILAACGIAGLAIVLYFVTKKKGNQGSGEETRVIREIHTGLQGMEKRIDSMEGIVAESSDYTHEVSTP
jgi:hypothetical protein